MIQEEAEQKRLRGYDKLLLSFVPVSNGLVVVLWVYAGKRKAGVSMGRIEL